MAEGAISIEASCSVTTKRKSAPVTIIGAAKPLPDTRPAVAWNQSDTLAQSYGKGDFAFVAVQSGNRIDLPAEAARIAFRYLGKDGKSIPFENPVPSGVME